MGCIVVRISAPVNNFGAGICMIGNRLREERERLGLTQPVFAELAGAKKRTLIDWEKDVSSPTAVQLAQLAAAGADVLYILTGQRSQPVPPAQELPRQEQEWLALYRNSSEEVRAALKAAGNELTKPARARGKAA
jgi:transcriptional regulator with XRE-family HTH domain